MRYLLFLTLFSSNLLAQSLTEINNDFNQFFSRELKKQNIPGAAYTVVHKDQIIGQHTYGVINKNSKQPVTVETRFRLASVSKPFAATLATMLAHENRLDLTDPVTKYVPGFQLAKAGAADKISLSHILSHSSGLMPNAYDNLLNEHWPLGKIIDRFDRVEPICEPAACYGYQNIAFSFIEQAMEQKTGKSYSELIQEKIFTPLKMDNASIGYESYVNQANSAAPHVLIRKKATGRKDRQGKKIYRYFWKEVDVEPNYYQVASAAGVNASIADLSQWLIANLGYRPVVLPSHVLRTLTTPRIETRRDLRRSYWRDHLQAASYGYGWRIYQFDGHPLIYHSGWVSGFRADIAYSPELEIGFALLMNAESNNISQLSTYFWQQVFSQLDTEKLAQQNDYN